MIEPDLFSVLRLVRDRLNEVGISFLVGGSLASSVFGEPRLTRDIDLVVEMGPERIEPLAVALEHDFYVSRPAMREAVAVSRSFNAVHLESGIKVDFFVRGHTPFDLEEFRRRRDLASLGNPPFVVPVKTVEDSILRKLKWYRDGGQVANQQWRDVLGLAALNRAALDDAYLDHWAGELGITDLLARIRVEAVD